MNKQVLDRVRPAMMPDERCRGRTDLGNHPEWSSLMDTRRRAAMAQAPQQPPR
jgi:hypothetical protein